MDPNANLEEQLRLASRLVESVESGRFVDAMKRDGRLVNDAHRLAELVIALDQWIKSGGFLPKAWERK